MNNSQPTPDYDIDKLEAAEVYLYRAAALLHDMRLFDGDEFDQACTQHARAALAMVASPVELARRGELMAHDNDHAAVA